MIVPNKFVSFSESILGRLPGLLSFDAKEIGVNELFSLSKNNFECIDHFIYTLDVLYILGKIDVDLKRQVVIYAD
jgi:hypothetical protein